MKPNLQSVIDAFFAAMKAGYAQGAPESGIIQIPGSKMVSHMHGDFQITDVWFVTPQSERSNGMTLILYHGQIVWCMQYGGEYPKSVIPFLKVCLHKAYVTDRAFYGCRGPNRMKEEMPPGRMGLHYENHWSGGFHDFQGEERIYYPSGDCAGYHWFKGGLMTSDKIEA